MYQTTWRHSEKIFAVTTLRTYFLPIPENRNPKYLIINHATQFLARYYYCSYCCWRCGYSNNSYDNNPLFIYVLNSRARGQLQSEMMMVVVVLLLVAKAILIWIMKYLLKFKSEIWENGVWECQVRDKDKWLALVDTKVKLWVPYKARDF
jgi:hypothetical protein